MTVDNNEFTRIDRVAVVPLEDVSKLLMPLPVVCNRIGNHDLGVVCQAVAGALLCSVWDLVVYQVPPIALDWDIFKSVYAIFRSSSPGEHLFMGYYGVEELKEEDGAGIDTSGGVTDEEVRKNLHLHMELTIDRFLSDCCLLEHGYQTLRTSVYDAFQFWAYSNEDYETKEMVTTRIITYILKRKGIERGGIRGEYYVGLGLLET